MILDFQGGAKKPIGQINYENNLASTTLRGKLMSEDIQ